MISKIEISTKAILLGLAIVAGAWVVVQIRDILFLLFVAFLLMTAIHPLVVALQRLRIPRVLGILIVYTVMFGVFGVSFAGALPALVVQVTKLIAEFPTFITRVLPYWNIDANTIGQQIAPFGENVVKLTVGVFSNAVAILTVLVFTFYFLLEREHAEDIITTMVGAGVAKDILDVLRKVERRLGAWVRGELVLMLFVGIFSYVGLTILQVDFALPLAIVAGILEIIPLIGPTVSAVPAVLVALATTPLLAVSVVILYFFIQQIENNLLVPFVMKKSIGLSPLITILSLMVGGKLAGIFGAVLSIPIMLVIQVLLAEFLTKSSRA